MISIDIGNNKSVYYVTTGAVIWFCRKTAWIKLWSCRSLKFSFWTHFWIGTKQWNRLDHSWIATAKIYNDSVRDVIVLWVWIPCVELPSCTWKFQITTRKLCLGISKSLFGALEHISVWIPDGFKGRVYI